VAINDVLVIRKIGIVIGIQENGPCHMFCLLKSMCQVIGVIVSLNYRVINAGIRDPDPCNDIRIDLF